MLSTPNRPTANRPGVSVEARTVPVLSFSPLQDAGRLTQAISRLGIAIAVDRNCQVFGELEPAQYYYWIKSGLVRTCRFLRDGRRQIAAFHFPGDIFGFTSTALHGLSAEAAEPSRLVAVKRETLFAAAAEDVGLAMALLDLAVDELRRTREHVVLLGKTTAPERIVAFLHGLAAAHARGEIVDIPMSRQDIADYLGLTIETVSRTLTQFGETGIIELESTRRMRICSLA